MNVKFAKDLAQKARAVGIVDVGVNDYYTSQKYPCCLARLYESIVENVECSLITKMQQLKTL
jgi:hypothetical protein